MHGTVNSGTLRHGPARVSLADMPMCLLLEAGYVDFSTGQRATRLLALRSLHTADP
jgi:hypothetical protein